MRAWHSIVILFLLAPKASAQERAKLVTNDAAAGDDYDISHGQESVVEQRGRRVLYEPTCIERGEYCTVGGDGSYKPCCKSKDSCFKEHQEATAVTLQRCFGCVHEIDNG